MESGTTCWVLKVATVAKTTETTKKSPKTPPKDPLRHQSQLKNKTGCEIYTSRWCKPIPKGDATSTKANHVLSLPLTVSTRRVEPITSKATVSGEAPVLAKTESKEGSRELEDLTLKSHQE